MEFCPDCGARLASDARFCVECGASLNAFRAAPPKATVVPIAAKPAGPAAKAGRGWLRFLVVAAVVAVAVGLIWQGLSNDVPASPTPSASTSRPDPAPSASPPATSSPVGQATLGSNLQEAVGEWTVDPKDPLYSSSDSNALVLHSDGSQLKGVGPEGAQLRFWDDGSSVVGEATDVDGKIWKLRWQWLEVGTRARMGVSDGQDSHEVTLIRPSAAIEAAAPAPAPKPPLFEAQGDLNSDGALETVRVVALAPGALANSKADKRIEIVGADGGMLFESEAFQEPFRTDLDDMAETPEQKAGLHILGSSEGYPVIRVIFVCRSGNFVDFQFDGQSYVVAGQGN